MFLPVWLLFSSPVFILLLLLLSLLLVLVGLCRLPLGLYCF